MDFSKSKFDIIGKARIWYTISAVIIILGLIGMGINLANADERFPLRRGIDFAGGSIIQLQIDNWSEQQDPGH